MYHTLFQVVSSIVKLVAKAFPRVILRLNLAHKLRIIWAWLYSSLVSVKTMFVHFSSLILSQCVLMACFLKKFCSFCPAWNAEFRNQRPSQLTRSRLKKKTRSHLGRLWWRVGLPVWAATQRGLARAKQCSRLDPCEPPGRHRKTNSQTEERPRAPRR